ncbi:MAG: PSD1 and planctomycete cytochrome C domain-containing protein [Pirellula sp.]
MGAERFVTTCGLVWACFCWLLAAGFAHARPGDESLARDVYTILNRSCLECHGAARQDGGLRLDSVEGIAKGGDSGLVVDRKLVDASELMRRIRLPRGDDEVMPKRGDVLNGRDIARIRDWIQAGMPWSSQTAIQKHWAYVPPTKPKMVGQISVSNAVDQIVQNKLTAEGLGFSNAAEPHVLIRRLYLDTIGLPPTPRETNSFAIDASVNLQAATERWVDRLLSSLQYGEKWARPWLDAARFADSHGFQRDDLHELWAYRDWVIQALNSDMPFDQFTIEQLAGDLLPNATPAQRIATGFNRCAPCNVEAGTDPIENRFNQVVDRVNTLGYVWLGTSLECAQCHDHKYDPFTQRDYYGLFAFFDQTELEADRANPKVPGSIRFIGPYMDLKDKQLEYDMSALDNKIAIAKKELESAIQLHSNVEGAAAIASTRSVLKPIQFDSSGGSSFEILDDRSVLLQDEPPDTDTYTLTVDLGQTVPTNVVGFLLETLTDPSLPGTGPGRGDAERPNFVLNNFEVAVLGNGDARPNRPLELIDAIADYSQKNYEVSNAIDNKLNTAWAIGAQFKRPHWAAFRLVDSSLLSGAKQLQFTLVQNFGNARTIGRFRLSALVGDYEKALPIEKKEPPQIKELRKRLADLQTQRSKLSIPKTLVMQQVPELRQSTMFARGDYRKPTDSIAPATPAVLHEFEPSGPRDRLALARWLVSPKNPLVARVIVNRLWTEIFGVGIVTTPEDFGIKGESPSHPELLDALAVSFVEEGWSQKKLLRHILTSQTYRQSSKCSVELRELDPQNRLLARGPRFRLPAESIRDNALAIAGKLSLKQFGPPIRPPQPEGLWKKVGGQQYDYEVSPGDEQYRRGIYVVLKRMSPYPSFINFDATARLACRVNRGRSNTPLQALNLLNDPVYVEAARGLASRVENEVPGDGLSSQLEHAFRIAVARQPSDLELRTLQVLFESEREAVGRESSAEVARSSAWFAVASALLNLDETITKE